MLKQTVFTIVAVDHENDGNAIVAVVRSYNKDTAMRSFSVDYSPCDIDILAVFPGKHASLLNTKIEVH